MRLTQRTVAFGVIIALFGACDSGNETTKQGQQSSTTTAVPEGIPPTGRFLAVAGERSLDAGLYEIRFGPLRLERLTKTSRVGAVDACPGQVVVAAAQQEVGFSDTLQTLRAEQLVPFEGLGDAKGSTPALASDCRMAYKAVDRTDPAALVMRLHLWDPGSQTDTVLHSAAQILGMDTGPDGQLAAVEGAPGNPGQPIPSTAIVIVSADQSVRSIPAPAADLGVLRWGASSRLAFGRNDAKTVLFLNPETGERSELPGWRPLAWSPDGSELLVCDSAEYKTLGVVRASDLSSVRTLGRTEVGVYDVAWLPVGAAPDRAGQPGAGEVER
jgi:hypothetical protein